MSLTLNAFIALFEGRDDGLYADDEEYRPRSLSKELTYFEKVKQRCSPRPSIPYDRTILIRFPISGSPNACQHAEIMPLLSTFMLWWSL